MYATTLISAHKSVWSYRHREEARRNRIECMSIIIDGVDQTKTNLPHQARE